MERLTLQVCYNQQWLDALMLEFPAPELGPKGEVKASYNTAYALQCVNKEVNPLLACSLTFPPDLFNTQVQKTWFSWLDDVRPAGASERYWAQNLGLTHLTKNQRAFALLQRGAIAPVGNLRIKESLNKPEIGSQLDILRFTVSQVVERDSDFLAYAQAMGASPGGATGAGGEAPKFLLRLSAEDEVWIDTYQHDFSQQDAYYLVKFPRNQRTADDCDILRTEFHYYHELAALGINTINTNGMRLLEGERYPSLWLPRFDRALTPQAQTQFHGLESIYSVLNKPPATALRHTEIIEQVITKLEGYPVFNAKEFILEWVKRDFLNVVFGNSDNHGRNSAFLKTSSSIALSPIYDFAPMKADPEGVMRTTSWGSPLEEGPSFNWLGICGAVANIYPQFVTADQLVAELKMLAQKLYGLESRLKARGVPIRILQFPAIGLASLDAKLERWGLLK